MRSNQSHQYCTLLTGLALAGLLAAAGSRVEATALSWNNSGGGTASTAANWSPAQVPTGADDLTFNLNNVYTVTFNSSVTASRTHTYRTGTVTLSATSPHTVSTGITVGDLNGDNATMTLTTGTLTSNAAFVVGDASGSNGVLNVNDDDADLIIANGADLTIGNNGDAALNITGTGRVEVADQFIAGANSSSTPTITISGFQISPLGASILDVLGTGQSRIGQGGDAAMTISNGAGALFAGDLVIANGSASVSSVTVETAGLLNARLVVDGDLMVGRNSSTSIAAGVGSIFLNTGGQVDVGGNTFLGDPDGGSGTINLSGGTFNGGAAINMLAGSIITGTGTIDADIINQGSIQPTGANGLTLSGILNSTTSNTVSGTKIHFGPGGGYNGAGACAADITGDPTAVITATGPLSIGRNTTAGFSYLGALNVGSHAVTLVDSNGAVLGGLTTLNGGSLACTNGIGVQNGAAVKGEGTLIGNATFAGVIDPDSPASDGGLMTIQGNLHLNPTGIMDMTIGGSPPSGNNDRVNVSGTATFGGTIRVNLKNGYVPHVGEQFIAINATGGRTGEFATIIPPSPAPCNNVTFVMVYSSTAAIVLIRPPLGCTALGDLNSDGSINGKDIGIFVGNVLNGVYDSCTDMNGDCADDPGDIPIFINALL